MCPKFTVQTGCLYVFKTFLNSLRSMALKVRYIDAYNFRFIDITNNASQMFPTCSL